MTGFLNAVSGDAPQIVKKLYTFISITSGRNSNSSKRAVEKTIKALIERTEALFIAYFPHIWVTVFFDLSGVVLKTAA